MAIELKEYVGHEFLSVQQNNPRIKNISESNVQTYIDENSLMVDIEAIHSRITRNFTYYSPECLKESVPYWTNPYERPVIMHHNEKDGHIIGRIKSAEYKETGTRNNLPGLVFTANIGDEEGKKGIKNGTLSTVSIGVIAHDLRCSICGTNLAEEGMCGHEKGEEYDGELCYWIINKMEPKEVSYVIVPSDIYAHNLRVYDAIKKNKGEVKNKMENYNPFAELAESIKTALSKNEEEITTQESKQIDEEIKDETVIKSEAEELENTSEEEKEPVEENSSEIEEKEEKTEEVKEDSEEVKEEKSNKEVEDLKAKLEKAKKEIADLKVENEKLNKTVNHEKKLRESAETELLTLKTEKKQGLVENVNKLRESLNLPKEDVSILMESSEENLSLSIKQLKEFKEVQNKHFGLNMIESPISVSDDKDNTIKENKKNNVKEFSSASNISLEEQILNTINSLW